MGEIMTMGFQGTVDKCDDSDGDRMTLKAVEGNIVDCHEDHIVCPGQERSYEYMT